MKKRTTFIFLITIATTSVLHLFAAKRAISMADLEGAWRLQDGQHEQVLLIKDGYFSHTTFDSRAKKFVQTNGGTIKLNGAKVEIVSEFDTKSVDQIGASKTIDFDLKGNELTMAVGGATQKWTRTDDGSGPLAGTWKITGRKQGGGDIVKIHQTGPRKTLKILTGKRFQWVAINPETREFFGTGGGNYTFANGKYTENIEFFSRDSSRVGASLSFDGKVVDGEWHHSGKSSRGDDIYEVWGRINR
jgi:hypothetical protein